MDTSPIAQNFNSVHCVFLCGGSGTRLWPLSRKAFPKQFLSLDNATEHSLLQSSIERIESIVPVERRWIVTAREQCGVANQQTKEKIKHTLVESAARNTAAAIAWAAWELLKVDRNAVMVVLSSDHVIKNIQGFQTTLAKAVQLAGEHKRFVTVGIQPTFASTGFGYIERGGELGDLGFDVKSFREKPDAKTAEQFVLSGRYLWNAGMFVWNVQEFWTEFKKLQPDMANFFETAKNTAEIEANYKSIASLPIDIAFMERTTRAACVPSIFDWDDIGSWAAVRTCFANNAETQNCTSGDVLTLDTSSSLVMAQKGKFVATLGVKDLCVVATDDAVLVMPLNRAQDIKQIISHLEKNNRTELL